MRETRKPHARSGNLNKLYQLSGLIFLALGTALLVAVAPALAQEASNGVSFNPQEWLRNAL
ncbi:MAG TPA: TVP38/TMEM64 family protein, partial [Cyanobacteria bacterium UBA11166]|nr:TVP38/TMEM64 family protein [Cyanobacteria bacterium UBA11166]